MERRYLLDASQTQKECQRLESRNREIDEMFLSLYTDKAKGILTEQRFMKLTATLEQEQEANQKRLQDLLLMMRHSDEQENEVRTVPFPVSWTVKMKKKQKETQDILSYHSQAAGCSDKARAKASGGRQPIEECGRTGL